MPKTLERTTPAQLVKQRMDGMIQSLPGEGTARKRFAQAAIGVCSQPSIAKCEPSSVAKAIYVCARLGLIPDPVLHLVAIVPFRNKGILEATPIIEYRGIVELARRADPGLYIDCKTVYEGDDYVLEEGLRPNLRVKKRWWERGMAEPGPAIFSYCISGQTGGERAITTVSKQEGLKIANSCKAGRRKGTPWFDHEDRMREKTCVHRASRFWRLATDSDATHQFREAMEYDDADANDLAAPADPANILGDMGELPGQEAAEEPGSGLDEGTTRGGSKAATPPPAKTATPAESSPVGAPPMDAVEKRRAIFSQMIDVKLDEGGRSKPGVGPTPFDRDALLAFVVGAEGNALAQALQSASEDDFIAWTAVLKGVEIADVWPNPTEAPA